MNKEKVCEKNCPDYKGMGILHNEQCDCSCHKTMNSYKPKTKEWFLERVGKRIFRDKQKELCCQTCGMVEVYGLVIIDEEHAFYLSHIDSDFANDGVYSNYRDIQ